MKELSDKISKAYTTDLNQFSEFCFDKPWREKETIEEYIKTSIPTISQKLQKNRLFEDFLLLFRKQ